MAPIFGSGDSQLGNLDRGLSIKRGYTKALRLWNRRAMNWNSSTGSGSSNDIRKPGVDPALPGSVAAEDLFSLKFRSGEGTVRRRTPKGGRPAEDPPGNSNAVRADPDQIKLMGLIYDSQIRLLFCIHHTDGKLADFSL